MNARKLGSRELIREETVISGEVQPFTKRGIGASAVALQELRRKGNGNQLTEDEKNELINELELHQVELESQNQELTAARFSAQEAAEKYTELYDFAPLGYFALSKTGNIRELNLRGAEILGEVRKQLINSRFDFYVSAESRPVFNHFLAQVFNNHSKESCEVILTSDCDVPLNIKLTGIISKKHDHCLVTAVNITGHKQSEIDVQESESRLNKIQSIAHMGSWEMDIQTEKLIWSDEVYRIYGLRPNEFAATYQTIIDLVHPDDLDSLNSAFNNSLLKNKDCFEIEHRIIRAHTGEVRNIYQKCEHIRDGSGVIVRCVGIVQDITERKQAEEIIRFKNEELLKINAEKDKYFSIIAHDLRSPFSGFLGLTELMDKGLSHMKQSEIQEIALLLHNSAAHLFTLLGNLLEWSCMQRGLTTFVPVTILLKPKISNITEGLLEPARQKKIALNVIIPDDIVVFADVNMFESIIRNLVSNAVKFTRRGGVITVTAKSVPDNQVEISVIDSGIGMNEIMIDQLFRLDVNTNRKGTEGEYSTGLGLTISKDFIEKNGGRLKIESDEKSGSIFSFTMPAKSPSEKPLPFTKIA